MAVNEIRKEVRNGRGLLFELGNKKVEVSGSTEIDELERKVGKELTVEDILSATWYLN